MMLVATVLDTDASHFLIWLWELVVVALHMTNLLTQLWRWCDIWEASTGGCKEEVWSRPTRLECCAAALPAELALPSTFPAQAKYRSIYGVPDEHSPPLIVSTCRVPSSHHNHLL